MEVELGCSLGTWGKGWAHKQFGQGESGSLITPQKSCEPSATLNQTRRSGQHGIAQLKFNRKRKKLEKKMTKNI